MRILRGFLCQIFVWGCLVFWGTNQVQAASKYWVGGTGNWSNRNHWSNSSGGPGMATLPTSADDVYFDANSFTAPGQVVTYDQILEMHDINWTGVTNNPSFDQTDKILTVFGSLIYVPEMTIINNNHSDIDFRAMDTGHIIKFAHSYSNGTWWFGGAGGEWTIQDDITFSPTRGIQIDKGTVNTNGKTITGSMSFWQDSIHKTLNLGSSTYNCTNWFMDASDAANITINAGTSTINMIGDGSTNFFSGAGKTFNKVTFASGYGTMMGQNTFNELSMIGEPIRNGSLLLADSQNVTGTFTISGNSPSNRILVTTTFDFSSPNDGNAKTITANNTVLENVDFKDITAAGAASWAGTSVGNALGNTGITFTPAVTRYWVASSGGNWGDTSSWSTTSGGASGASVPLPQDAAIINGNSIGSSSRTITADMPRLGGDITFAGVLHNPTLKTNDTAESFDNTIFGSLNVTGINITGTKKIVLSARTPKTLTNGAASWSSKLEVGALGGTYTLQDDLTMTDTFSAYAGTFDANDRNLTAKNYNLYSYSGLSPTIVMGSGIWEATSNDNVVSYPWTVDEAMGGSVNIVKETSTIKFTDITSFTKTFYGGNKTYYDLWLSGNGTGNYIVSGGNTFSNIKIDNPPHTILFEPGKTQTVDSLSLSGTVGKLVTLDHSGSGDPFVITKPSGIVGLDYLNLSNSNVMGGALWYAGSHSNNTTNNTGWLFADAPTPTPSPSPIPTSNPSAEQPHSDPAPSTSCNSSVTALVPDLFEVRTTKNTATLYFAPPAGEYSSFYVSYSRYPDYFEYGAEYSQNYSTGVLQYTIGQLQPNTRYYFRIRPGNGCATGNFGNTMTATTNSNVRQTAAFYKGTKIFAQVSKVIKKIVGGNPINKPSLPSPAVTPSPISAPSPKVEPQQSNTKKFCIWKWCF